MRSRKRSWLLSAFLWIIAAFYGVILVYLLFIRNRVHHMPGAEAHRFDWTRPFANLTPFQTIRSYLLHSDRYNFDIWFEVFFGNMVLFMPFGVLAPLISRRMRSFPRFLIVLIVVLLGVEVAQKVTLTGAFDVDDIILNLLGAVFSYSLTRLFLRFVKS